MILADLGAQVIKIERPDGGDITRAWGPPWAGGEATYYLSTNRGKRSLSVDLHDPTGIAVVRRLADTSDVVIENFIPGGADRLGLGWDTLCVDHPSLVYCSISGYPIDSPEAALPGFDFAIQGAGGLMSITGETAGRPLKVGVAISDLTTGMFAATGILAALYAVRAGSPGQHVQVSLLDAQLAWLANRGTEASITGITPERLGNAHPSVVPYETFPTVSTEIIVAVGTDSQFRALCEVLGVPELGTDRRFSTNSSRVAHRSTLVPLLAEQTAKWQPNQLLLALTECDIPSGPVRTITEALAASPYALQPHDHPTAGRIHTIRSPIALDGTYLTADRHPPLLGEHNAEILREAGFSEAECAALIAGPCRNAS